MKLYITISSLLLILLGASASQALTVRFHPQAVVDGEDVTLGAIASITPAGKRSRGLAGISLAAAPAPGSELRMQSRDLWARLCRLEPDLAGADHQGADVVVIRRAGVPFGPRKVQTLLEKYLQSQQQRFPGMTLNLVNLQLPRPFVLPKGTLRTEIRPSDPDILHSRSFNILFRVEDRPVRNLTVRGQIEALAEVPTMIRDLPRGSILRATDLQLVRRNIVPMRNPCLDLNQLIGKKTRRSLRRGQPLTRSMVISPPVVKRGEMVTISLQHGGLSISTRGIARHNGEIGDTIPVRNSNSQRDILCKVIAPGQVKVGF